MRLLTNKDNIVKDYLLGLGGVASKKHLQHFVKSNSRCIHRLVENQIVTEKKGIIQVKDHVIEDSQMRCRLMILDVLDQLYQKGKITTEINVTDEPFHFMAKSVKAKQYVYFTLIEEGKETIRCQMIDNMNRGNTIIVLESKHQLEKLSLKTKVSDIYYYQDYVSS